MSYKATETLLPEVILLEPNVHSDDRGFFYESFNKRDFYEATGCDVEFVQDNVSFSHYGVIRGLHFQNPNPQGKLVRVIAGAIFDVAVDLRKNSPNFGKSVAIELSEKNNLQLWVPEGFAHGFQVISNDATVVYKTSDFWNQASEQILAWDDPLLSIPWPIQKKITLNEKDLSGKTLNHSKIFV